MTTADSISVFRIWIRRLHVMTVKEFLQLFRDLVLLVFIIYAFTADIYLAGSGVSLQVKEAPVYFMDNDKSQASREFLGRFLPPYFRVKGEVISPIEGTALLDKGDAMIVVDIPSSFQKSIFSGEPARIQVQIDTTNSGLGFLASSYAQQIAGKYGLEMAMERIGLVDSGHINAPMIIDDHRVWFNPNQDDRWFMSLSELLTIVTLFSVLLPGAAMVREKERGTVEQLLVSPLSSFQIMFPKVLSMTTVILIGSAISILFIIKGVFHVPLKGSLVLFFSITTLYVFTTAGLGLFISTIAKNLAQVGMMTVLIFVPMLFLSGAWTPPEAMPAWMRTVMYISPLHYYIDTGFGILLKGAGVRILWREILGMAALGSVIFGLGMWRFRKQFG
ncbi:ABC transporter permease [Desulforegula conservatrix]|uniref:ABC transporter permease n=1 Tax=Desulforegula conservatrix TaxID=153026 RepID=UPI00041B32F0|nr:ABC transporter permease [Desulforegula conservatrix]